MEIPITYGTSIFLLMNYRKNHHTESLNYNIRGQYPHIGQVVQFQTDRMRKDGENYEYTVLLANDSFEMLGSRRCKLLLLM